MGRQDKQGEREMEGGRKMPANAWKCHVRLEGRRGMQGGASREAVKGAITPL